MDLRLEGGAADEDGISSSGSRDRLRRVGLEAPRLAADMFDRRGELLGVSDKSGGVEWWVEGAVASGANEAPKELRGRTNLMGTVICQFKNGDVWLTEIESLLGRSVVIF